MSRMTDRLTAAGARAAKAAATGAATVLAREAEAALSGAVAEPAPDGVRLRGRFGRAAVEALVAFAAALLRARR